MGELSFCILLGMAAALLTRKFIATFFPDKEE
jgi:hypothetical protein